MHVRHVVLQQTPIVLVLRVAPLAQVGNTHTQSTNCRNKTKCVWQRQLSSCSVDAYCRCAILIHIHRHNEKYRQHGDSTGRISYNLVICPGTERKLGFSGAILSSIELTAAILLAHCGRNCTSIFSFTKVNAAVVFLQQKRHRIHR